MTNRMLKIEIANGVAWVKRGSTVLAIYTYRVTSKWAQIRAHDQAKAFALGYSMGQASGGNDALPQDRRPALATHRSTTDLLVYEATRAEDAQSNAA